MTPGPAWPARRLGKQSPWKFTDVSDKKSSSSLGCLFYLLLGVLFIVLLSRFLSDGNDDSTSESKSPPPARKKVSEWTAMDIIRGNENLRRKVTPGVDVSQPTTAWERDRIDRYFAETDPRTSDDEWDTILPK